MQISWEIDWQVLKGFNGWARGQEIIEWALNKWDGATGTFTCGSVPYQTNMLSGKLFDRPPQLHHAMQELLANEDTIAFVDSNSLTVDPEMTLGQFVAKLGEPLAKGWQQPGKRYAKEYRPFLAEQPVTLSVAKGLLACALLSIHGLAVGILL